MDWMKELYSLFSDADLVKVLNQRRVLTKFSSLYSLSHTPSLTPLLIFKEECDNSVFVGLA